MNSFGQKLLNFLFTGMLVPNRSISHWKLVDSHTQEVDQFFQQMNWSAVSNELMRYFINTFIATTVKAHEYTHDHE
jgi:hypothetical protein